MDKIKEEIRLIIAFAIAILIIIVFSRMQPRRQESITREPARQPAEPAKVYETEAPQEQHVFTPPAQTVQPSDEKKLIYDDGRYVMELNTVRGSIEDMGIKKYQRENEPYFTIFENSELFFDSGKDKAEYTLSHIDETAGIVEFDGRLKKNLKVVKRISVPSENHTFKASLILKNEGAENENIDTYAVRAGRIPANQPQARGERNFTPPEMLVYTNGQLVKTSVAKIKEDVYYENTGWIAWRQGYTLLMIKAESAAKGFIVKENNAVSFGFLYQDLNISAKEGKELTFSVYAGPSDYFVAKNEIAEKELFGGGVFASMGRFLFTMLAYIHRVIPNWGWAIVILTVIIKIIFFPLTRNSLKSMKALQKLRPYLQEIQKKHKNNPQQMQKEMMSLYKDYKINPLGGCIPMLLQFPIFIGFFLALRSSIFFRGASFGLWINDLSLPDSIAQIGDFNLNLLPLIMAATALWQQKLTPQDPSQKALTFMMPVMFLFLFYNFSAGLLLYWITMNMAGLVEQYFIHKK